MSTITSLSTLTQDEQDRLVEALYFAILYRSDREKELRFMSQSAMLAGWITIHEKLSGTNIAYP